MVKKIEGLIIIMILPSFVACSFGEDFSQQKDPSENSASAEINVGNSNSSSQGVVNKENSDIMKKYNLKYNLLEQGENSGK